MKHSELIAALLAAILGVGAVLFVLFGPLYTVEGGAASSDGATSTLSGSASPVSVGLDPLTAVVLGAAMLASLGIGLGGVLHARTGARTGRILLAVSIVVLLVVAVLGVLSVGVFLLPSVLLSVVALAAGSPPAPPPGARWPQR